MLYTIRNIFLVVLLSILLVFVVAGCGGGGVGNENANTTTYTLTVVSNGNGTVNSSPAGIDCGSDCTESFTVGNSVTLTATPAPGYQFNGWIGAGCSGTVPCVFDINADTTVTASFSLISVTSCGSGVIYDVGGTNGYGREYAVNTNTVSAPIDIAFIPGMGGAFVVISQSGIVYYFNGGCDPVSNVDIRDVASGGIGVVSGGEQGLLNVEFHPDFATYNYVFFYHTSVASTVNSVSRMTVAFDGSGNLVLSDPVKIIDFRKPNTASNHNGGGLVFAPDTTLLASVGDGGGSNGSNAQQSTSLLGSVIRVSPSLNTGVGGYSIPSGNMFTSTNSQCSNVAQSTEDCPEILAMGLRNPFRMSREANIVYLGDVGSGNEEINSFDYTSVDTSNPVNFGWNTHDGYVASSTIPGYRNPIVYYNRNDTVVAAFRAEDPEGTQTGNASIMIGDVYSGSRYGNELADKLFFAEFYDGFLRAVGVDSSGNITDADGVPGMHIIHHGQITSMVEGPDGYMYITTLYGPAMVYRLVKP